MPWSQPSLSPLPLGFPLASSPGDENASTANTSLPTRHKNPQPPSNRRDFSFHGMFHFPNLILYECCCIFELFGLLIHMRVTESHPKNIRSVQQSPLVESSSLRKRRMSEPLSTSRLILYSSRTHSDCSPRPTKIDNRSQESLQKHRKGTGGHRNIQEPETRYASTDYDNPRRIR